MLSNTVFDHWEVISWPFSFFGFCICFCKFHKNETWGGVDFFQNSYMHTYIKEYIQDIHSNARKSKQTDQQNPHSPAFGRARGRFAPLVCRFWFCLDFSLRCCVIPGYIPWYMAYIWLIYGLYMAARHTSTLVCAWMFDCTKHQVLFTWFQLSAPMSNLTQQVLNSHAYMFFSGSIIKLYMCNCMRAVKCPLIGNAP